jgi:choline dehydrogenase-like flavoprotein
VLEDYMLITRGASDDWDRFAKVTGENGWSWNEMQTYFKKSEKWSSPKDDHNTTGQFDPDVHGFDGLVHVSLAGYPSAIDDMVINATNELGGEFAFNLDQNSGNPLGIGLFQHFSTRNEFY